MLIDTVVNEGFNSNTYIVSAGDSKDVLVVDPAGDDEALLAFLKERAFVPRYILLTHEHVDHVTGTNSLKANFPESILVCSMACAEKIVDPRLNLSHYMGKPYASVPADIALNTEGKIDWHHEVCCHIWDGHSPGGMLIYIGGRYLFCGDQFIKGIKTVTNLPGGKKERVKACFAFIKSNFSPETLMMPGHGEPFLVADLELI